MLQQNPRFCPCGILAAVGLLLAGLLALAGCDGAEPAPPPGGADAREVRVASLVPAVSNMLLELGEGELLVAVSNYDTDPRLAGLPRVGDLLTIDWEQLASARPTHMVVQVSREKTPPGATERAEALGIELVHVRITRLEDIFDTFSQLERALTGRDDDLRWANRFRGELETAMPARPPESPVPALIALSPDLSFVVGQRNYLDDLLTNAGGRNVVPAEMADYPKLDREMLLSLRPRKVALILPDATEAQLAEARRAVGAMGEAWGVPWDQVIVITDPYAMVPGWSVIELSRRLTEGLEKGGGH